MVTQRWPHPRKMAADRIPSSVLAEGGRLSAGLLVEHASAINAAFGEDISSKLHPKRTVTCER